MATVLVVDDSPDAQRFLRSLCEHRAHAVQVAGDGPEGLALARQVHPDLVITDALLPTMNGYDVARAIRSDPGMAGTRVVLTTAATVDDALLDLARRCGMTAVIPKPSEPEHVLAVMDRTLAADPPPLLRAGDAEQFDAEQLRLLTAELSRRLEELRAAHEGLQRNEERFRRLLDLAPAAIVGVDGGGRITMVNALAEGMFGSTAADLVGQPLELLVPEPLRATHVKDRADYMASPSVRPMGVGRELQARRADGSHFPVTVSLSTTGAGADITVLAAVMDVSERVAAERERAELEACLAQAQRLESVGQLAGGVAHDFNNLLAVIINYAAFVGHAVAGDAAVVDDVRQIQVAARRGADLVRQLLLFSRNQQTIPEELVLAEVIGGVRELLERSIGERFTLAVRVDPDLPPVVINRGKLEQVFVNLIVNARDAMPEGGPISVDAGAVHRPTWTTLGYQANPGTHIRLAVGDAGVGMTAEVRERALEPFFTTKPRGQGTGLGLATVYGIVTEAGGGIELVTEPSRGTQVVLYLPVAHDGILMAGSSGPDGTVASDGNGETVLVVEDEPAVRELTRRILLRHGYDVVAAADPAEALAILDDMDTAPALVLSDVVMPGQSGPDLVQQLRERWPGMAALLMTGYAGHLDAGTLGGLDIVEKPFTERQLVARVHQAIVGTR